MPGDISINNVDDSGREVLNRYEASEAKKTLGVYLAMDGNNQEETRYLRDKAEEFADCVRTGFLSQEDATYALHRTIMKTLEYPLVATTMDKLQWDYIMSPIIKLTLPRMGFVRSFPRDVVYGPEDLCGLGVLTPLVQSTPVADEGTPTGNVTFVYYRRPYSSLLGTTTAGEWPTGSNGPMALESD
jgi:hypothetical protein